MQKVAQLLVVFASGFGACWVYRDSPAAGQPRERPGAAAACEAPTIRVSRPDGCGGHRALILAVRRQVPRGSPPIDFEPVPPGEVCAGRFAGPRDWAVEVNGTTYFARER